jgi:hypothetical protein
MNKIEQMHLDSIQNDKHIRKQLCVNDFGTSDLEKTVAAKSAEITEQIAIEFAEWCGNNVVYVPRTNFYWHKLKKYTPKELLQEFLKTKQ